ncbi:sirohydrochlorin chelatase [Nocardia sp. NPDC058176]|uniref:sirohydrochlorin chelatase n=1 Tax=Nocardia sp. NPDC058176 TaxID=3346368 RepID=UPI0036DF8388
MAPRGGGGPALLAVAHGSRDPRSAATMAAVVAEAAAARPDLTVRLAFLDLNAPSVEQVTDDLAAQGHTSVIVVPLLLGNAFHARVDLPALLAEATRRHPRLRLTQADVLGADPRLVAALADRVVAATTGVLVRPDAGGALEDREPHTSLPHSGIAAPSFAVPRTGTPPRFAGPAASLGIAVAAVGSRNAAANRRTAVVARRLSAATGIRTETCFATVEPGIEVAIDRLRARGAEHIVVAPWFLAPGLLTDRLLTAAPDLVHAAVIGAHPALTEVIWARYDSTIAAELELSA